jgi:hypothetical protein
MAISRSAGATRSPYRPLLSLVPYQVRPRRSLTVQAAAGPIPDLVGRDFTAGVSEASSLPLGYRTPQEVMNECPEMKAQPICRRSSRNTVVFSQIAPRSQPIKVTVEESILAKCGF